MDTKHNDLLAALLKDLAKALPTRYVKDDLILPAQAKNEELNAGIVCIVATGGGQFANWSGREGELGNLEITLVCHVQATGKTAKPGDVQRAELELLDELLAWCQSSKPAILGDTVPKAWRSSSQTSAPLGWLVLEMETRNL